MNKPQPWAAFYRLMKWLEIKIRKEEVEIIPDQWYHFSCWVRWNEAEQALEADAPDLRIGDIYGRKVVSSAAPFLVGQLREEQVVKEPTYNVDGPVTADFEEGSVGEWTGSTENEIGGE